MGIQAHYENSKKPETPPGKGKDGVKNLLRYYLYSAVLNAVVLAILMRDSEARTYTIALSWSMALFVIGWFCGDALRKMSRERAWKRRVREDIEELTRPQEVTRN